VAKCDSHGHAGDLTAGCLVSETLIPKSISPARRLNRNLLLVTAALAVFSGSAASQQSRPLLADPTLRAVSSDSLRIYLMTMGPGDEIWELFGHDAIWVHDPTQAIDTVYNWGVFDFSQPHFILNFLRDRNTYSMDGDPLDATIAFYHRLNRQVWAQELNLTATEKKSLIDFIHWNVRPENATYRYDYYLDNCSTRVRDVIDRATGGQIRAQLKAIKTAETYRSHSLRLMQRMPGIVAGVELLLGRPTDVKLSADQASFLPVQLMNHLRSVNLDGGRRPLFKDEFVVNEATRPPEPTTVPKLWLWFAPIALALSALVLWLSGTFGSPRPRRAAFTMSFLSAMIGLLGTIITGLMTLTDHTAARPNENFFMLNPLWLIIAVLAPMMILRPRPRRVARGIISLALGLACVAVISHLVFLSRQSNWDVIVLVLPVELAIGWTLLTRG
jgi:hypothetical protein